MLRRFRTVRGNSHDEIVVLAPFPIMLIRLRILLLLAAWSAMMPPAEAQNLLSGRGVLLLNNGELLSGVITHEGDRYLISLKHGEIRIREQQVEAKFDNANQAYTHLRDKIDSPSVEAHLALATWCIRNNLTTEAIDEIARVRLIDPGHRGAHALAEQILLRRAKADTENEATEQHKFPSEEDKLRQLVADLPEGSMEIFTTTIQPLLLNSCSTSACHGGRSESNFKLFRAGLGNRQSRQMTQLNLRNTLRFVDRKNPAASRLLSMAAEPHGEQRANLLGGVNSVSYRHLDRWVRGLAAETPATTVQDGPASVGDQDVILSQSIEQPHRRPFDAVVPGQMDVGDDGPRTIRSADLRLPVAEAQRHATGVPAGDDGNPWKFRQAGTTIWRLPEHGKPQLPPKANAAIPKQHEEALTGELNFTPRDPFDPQIFNRQFHAPASGTDNPPQN